MVSLFLLGDFRSSPLDKYAEFLSQSITFSRSSPHQKKVKTLTTNCTCRSQRKPVWKILSKNALTNVLLTTISSSQKGDRILTKMPLQLLQTLWSFLSLSLMKHNPAKPHHLSWCFEILVDYLSLQHFETSQKGTKRQSRGLHTPLFAINKSWTGLWRLQQITHTNV